MRGSITGIILAGGENKRLGGENKAFLPLGQNRVFDMVYNLQQKLFDEIVIVTNQPLDYLEWNAKIVTDLFDYRSSLTGIHAGLSVIGNDYAFICSCDAPFIKKEMVELILERSSPHIDVVVPEVTKGLEPLCALYSKRCVEAIARNLKQKKFAIRATYNSLRVKKISEVALRRCDPELHSFFNINTRQDLEEAQTWLAANPN